jgi:hypothetical protein
MMKKKETYISITPLPSFIPRQLALDILHSHSEIITLNPLVLSHQAIPAPRDAAADEYYSTWYEITERIQYIPGMGKMGSGKISFRGCFHDVPWGLQTHVYAPMGIDIRNHWRVGGNQPGESRQEIRELGIPGIPPDGLYLREDIEIRCNLTLVSFVKQQLKTSTKVLVDRLIKKAELLDSGVLQVMFNPAGKLKTVNPADRSDPTQQEETQDQYSQTGTLPRAPSFRLTYQLPTSPTFRPASMDGKNHWDTTSTRYSQAPYSPYALPQAPYPQPHQQSYYQPPPPQYQPGPQLPAQYSHSVQPQSSPAPIIMELPGDTYHHHAIPPPLQIQQQQPRELMADTRTPNSFLSTPSSIAPSDYKTSQHMATTNTAPSSRPTSYSSTNPGGGSDAGFQSPALDQKRFSG